MAPLNHFIKQYECEDVAYRHPTVAQQHPDPAPQILILEKAGCRKVTQLVPCTKESGTV